MLPVREDPEGITFDVLLTPRSSRERIGPVIEDRLKVAVTSPPVDGEANAALVACLARALGISRSSVRIVRGESSRRKTVRVSGVAKSAMERLLA